MRRMPARGPMHDSERGMALIFVTILLVVVLVGGMALVATTSGELSSSRGYRARAVTDACAEAALQKVRALMPGVTFDNASGELTVGGATLSYGPGHYTGGSGVSDTTPVTPLEPEAYDAAALFAGENITNHLGPQSSSGGGGLSALLETGMHVIKTTVVCEGGGYGAREMQVVFRYGTP